MLSIVLLAAAAAVGVMLALMHFRGRRPSIPLALGHGLFAAGGLIALLFMGLTGEAAGGWRIALGLLLLAALGGVALFAMHLRRGELSSPVVVIHAVVAVVGFAVLLVAVLG